MPKPPPPPAPDMPELERRVRTLTGAILGAVAFAACYALVLVLDQTTQLRSHLYPLIAGVLFYLAGDLIAIVWFRMLASQLQAYIKRLEYDMRAQAHGEHDEQDDEAHRHSAVDDGVEVIKAGASSAR